MDFTASWRIHSRDKVKEGRFSGAIRADDADDLPLVNVEIQIGNSH
jgi:hypothetical protein